MHLLTIILGLLMMSVTSLRAQETDSLENTQDDLAITAKFYGDSVVIRWMPVDPYYWREANKIGYTIERLKLPTDTITYADRELKTLNKEPIKPWPLEDWETLGDVNDAAAVAAMALYGDSFEPSGTTLDPSQQGLIATLKHQAQERNNRHFFAATAADQSPIVANALGLRWVDQDIEPGRKYVYWVHLADTSGTIQLDTAGIGIDTENIFAPAPANIQAKATDEGVRIIWDKVINQMFFSAYYIERATKEDGPYEQINALPFIKVNSELETDTTGIISYLDTLAENYKPYFYRVRGLDYFGDISPPSEVVSAMNIDRIPPGRATIMPALFNQNGYTDLQWMKETIEPDLAGFFVVRSPFNDGPFTRVNRRILPTDRRNYTDSTSNPTDKYYYRIEAIDTAGNSSFSFNSFVFAYDSVPPPPPQALGGEVDSLGNVHLHWAPVRERDLRGYRIFRANAADHTFMQVNKGEILDTTYVDTISIKTLTKHIFYRLVAIDETYNTSAFSEVLKLKRYDIVPPAPPTINAYQLDKGVVSLQWFLSASRDVVEQIIYRQEDNGDWQVLSRMDTTITQFTDSTLQGQTFYRYALASVDESGLESKQSPPFGIKTGDLDTLTNVQNLTITYDEDNNQMLLNWDYSYENEDYHFLIYRSVNDSGLKSYKTLKPGNNTFTDAAVRQKGNYQYAVRVVNENGKASALSATVQNNIQ